MELLDEPIRLANSGGATRPISPLAWTRRLADGLLEAREPRAEGAPRPSWEELERRRSSVWSLLLPDADTVALRGLPPESVELVLDLLDAEGVQRHQMTVEFEHERLYPTRDGSPVAEEAFRVVGSWGYLDRPEAQRRSDRVGGTAAEQIGRAHV